MTGEGSSQVQLRLLDLPTRGYFWERFPQPHAGVDEVGRGCLAGPVVAGAVILPPELKAYKPRQGEVSAAAKKRARKQFGLPGLDGLADSKTLDAPRREDLAARIKGCCIAWAVGVCWPREIERINIHRASLAAMERALRRLRTAPAFVAVDGTHPVPVATPQQAFVDGDAHVPSVAAASIIAKTVRDRIMVALDKRFPGYGFANHKGYATDEHREAIVRLGPSEMHRRSFKGVDAEYLKEHDSLWLPDI
jgi:ribonuclease HII